MAILWRTKICIHKNNKLAHHKSKSLKEVLPIGRDDHKGKSNQSKSLPQTPKNQKIQPHQMKEELAKEFAELRRPKRQNNKANQKK